MNVWEQDPKALHRAYESRLVAQWTEARDQVIAMEATAANTSRRKRSEDIALAEKYGMPEARDL